MSGHFEWNEAGFQEMMSDWDGPVGQAIIAATDLVAAKAKATAPVSNRGSKYAPPGFLRSRTRAAHPTHHSSNGWVLGLVGFGVSAGYPGWFASENLLGSTENANQFGTYGRRPIDHYLTKSLDVLDGFEWREA